MKIALYIVRNTYGYAAEGNNRRHWTRRLTHEEMAKDINIPRTSATNAIKQLIQMKVVEKKGLVYRINANTGDWLVSRNSTILYPNNYGDVNRQKMSDKPTEFVEKPYIDSSSNDDRPSISATPKENNKEKIKKNIKESYKFAYKQQNLAQLLKKYTELYKDHAHKEYRNWQPENQNRDPILFDQICLAVAKNKPADRDENTLWKYLPKLMEHYFSTNPTDAVKTGISGFLSKIERLMGEYPWNQVNT